MRTIIGTARMIHMKSARPSAHHNGKPMSRAVIGQAGWRDRFNGTMRLVFDSQPLTRLTGSMRLLLDSALLATGPVYARIASLPSSGLARWLSVDGKPV